VAHYGISDNARQHVLRRAIAAAVIRAQGEAKRLVQGGGVAVNNVRVDDARKAITASDFIEGQVLVLRKGARHYHLIKIK